MSMNDPLGDMLTRIRNAQMRKKVKVSTPASKLRQRVLDVLAAEGYIRGYTTVEFEGGKSELEIELKYFDGEPVIRGNPACVEAWSSRVCVCEEYSAHPERSWHLDRVHTARRDGRS